MPRMTHKQATKGVYLINARGTENCNSTISKVCPFLDKKVGSSQLEAWNQYERLCTSLMNKLQSGREPESLNRTKSGMKEITNDDLSFIGESIDPAEQGIEITIVEVIGLIMKEQELTAVAECAKE
jgi:hypothetical protein